MSENDKIQRVEIVITGIVQGVCFRAETRDFAYTIGVGGTVRNLPNGSVEIIAEGDKENLEKLIKYARKGPSSAQVYNTSVKWEKPKKDFSQFSIVY
ncbi:Acylphosphatase [subsurface metagenome]